MKIFAASLTALAMALAAGCSQDDHSAEKAGKALDQAMEKAGNYTGEKLQEAGQAIKHAGEELKK